MQPFEIDISDEAINDLHRRLDHARLPPPSPAAAWQDGTDHDALVDLCHYWRDGFDWPSQQHSLNQLPQLTTEIDGQRLHAVHTTSPEPDAIPLVLLHGWPGSFAEFRDIVRPLSDPRAHGDDPADAFHIVCPSLPGYTFSTPVNDPGWNHRRIAAAVDELMRLLGYDKYGAQGGDWGSFIARQIALQAPERVTGIHLNLVVTPPPPDEEPAQMSEQERQALADLDHYRQWGSAYVEIQSTRPRTLGYALEDSPLGLAAWMFEKYREWSHGEVPGAISRDQLLTNISLYWFTRSATSAARLYHEVRLADGPLSDQRVETPTGCAILPGEIFRPARRWVQPHYNVTHFSELPAGGHFAAMEVPKLLVEDIRSFFRPLR